MRHKGLWQSLLVVFLAVVLVLLVSVVGSAKHAPQYIPPENFVEGVYCQPGCFYTHFAWVTEPADCYRSGEPSGVGMNDPCGGTKDVFVRLTGTEQFVYIGCGGCNE